jgi:hypothetical protein
MRCSIQRMIQRHSPLAPTQLADGRSSVVIKKSPGLSSPTLSRSSFASDAPEHGTLIDLRKLDRYSSVIADRTFAV